MILVVYRWFKVKRIMEVLSKYSKIKTIEGSDAVRIPDSILSLQETIPTVINLSTPCTPSTKILNYQINPVVEYELLLSDSYVETEVCVSVSFRVGLGYNEVKCMLTEG